jgi:hypothetical protein
MIRFLFLISFISMFSLAANAQTLPNGDFNRIYWNHGTLVNAGLELGTRLGAGVAIFEASYVDFHYANGLSEDYNVRLINRQDYRLQLMGGSFYIGDGYADPNMGSHRFAVDGTILSTGVTVKLKGAWPDYVFSKNYKLRTLPELENFIKDKGHLPEIPAAGEVEKSGIDLAEMDAKLLQKIEELTLYIIEQNKKIEQLEGKINTLSK